MEIRIITEINKKYKAESGVTIEQLEQALNGLRLQGLARAELDIQRDGDYFFLSTETQDITSESVEI